MPGHTCRAAPAARPAARRCRRSGRLGGRPTRARGGSPRTASRSTSCTLAPNAAHGTRSGWVRAVVDLCSPHVQPSITRSSHQRSCSTSARRSTSSSVNANAAPGPSSTSIRQPIRSSLSGMSRAWARHESRSVSGSSSQETSEGFETTVSPFASSLFTYSSWIASASRSSRVMEPQQGRRPREHRRSIAPRTGAACGRRA